jgi:hypothetical protein
MDGSLVVGQDLHLDVAGVRHVPLHIHRRVGEEPGTSRGGGVHRLPQLVRIGGDPHPDAPAPHHGLHHEGKAQPFAGLHCLVHLGKWAGSRQDREVRLIERTAGGHLVPGQLEHLGRRPDPHEAGPQAGPGERRALGQEPVARMDRLRLGGQSGLHDGARIEVRGRRGGLADPNGPIRLPDVLGLLVGVRVHRDGFDAQALQGSNHPTGDLAPVRHQHSVEHPAEDSLGGRAPQHGNPAAVMSLHPQACRARRLPR